MHGRAVVTGTNDLTVLLQWELQRIACMIC